MRRILILGDSSYIVPFYSRGQVDFISPGSKARDQISHKYDYVVFTGGTDINSLLYKESPHPRNDDPDTNRDAAEAACFVKCFELGIPTVGICRGMQHQVVVNGGSLIQHVTNHSTKWGHNITTYAGKVIPCNSDHHQMAKLNPKVKHSLLAWAEHVSDTYEGAKGITYTTGEIDPQYEPEAVWFPETESLGVQFHPEWLDKAHPAAQFFQHLLNVYIGA